MSRQKATKTHVARVPFQRAKSRLNTATQPGDLWKARQLKEYRITNNLCFSCGDKYVPGHVCAKVAPTAVLNNIEVGWMGEE